MNTPQAMISQARKLTAQASTAITAGQYETAADLLYEAGEMLVNAARVWRTERELHQSAAALHRAYTAETESGHLFLQSKQWRGKANGGHG